MLDTNDLDYYRKRERTAREHAAAATDPAIRSVHLEMAERYAGLIAERTTPDAPRRKPLKLKLDTASA